VSKQKPTSLIETVESRRTWNHETRARDEQSIPTANLSQRSRKNFSVN